MRATEFITEQPINEKPLDDITLQRALKFGSQMDMDKKMNPGELSITDKKTKDFIAKARAQDKSQRVTNVPARAHSKDGVHKQGFKPVKFSTNAQDTKINMTTFEDVQAAIREHVAKNVPFTECMFRPGSEAFTEFYRQVRECADKLNLDWEDQELIATDIGECIMVEGEMVALDVPMIEEEDLDEAEYQGRKVKLNSPKRGGSKKFYVYTKNKKGNVIKVSWGDTTGLSVKAKNRGAVKSFVARHKCKEKNDKTKAGYWACRTPRYKSLGVKGGQWW